MTVVCLRCMGFGRIYISKRFVDCACVTDEAYKKRLQERQNSQSEESTMAATREFRNSYTYGEWDERSERQTNTMTTQGNGIQTTPDGGIRGPRPTAKEAELGKFKARAIKGSEQFGFSGENQTLQIGIDMTIAMKAGDFVMTTMLFFAPKAAPFSVQRLQMLGWKGNGVGDLAAALAEGATSIEGIERNEVEVEITAREYEGRPQWRCEINVGPGKVTMSNTVDPKEFAARLRATAMTTAAASTSTGGGEAPPF